MILDMLHSALGYAPMGFEALEYVFGYLLLLIGLFIVYKIIDVFFSIIKHGRR